VRGEEVFLRSKNISSNLDDEELTMRKNPNGGNPDEERFPPNFNDEEGGRPTRSYNLAEISTRRRISAIGMMTKRQMTRGLPTNLALA
jgi:hypothetical protein